MGDYILRRINFGYDDIEPIIISMMVLGKNFIMIGRHGTGKTKIAKFLSDCFDNTSEEGFVFYDATKDDLISIAGIPNPESMKQGNLEFVSHKRTIWDKTTIVVDEITRASKENQNMWLEIMEEKTCFGIPLKYRSFIATANPESYASANHLDEALLDRFYAVVPIPELQNNISSDDVGEIVKLNLSTITKEEKKTEVANYLSNLFRDIQKNYRDYYSQNIVLKAIEQYTGQVISNLLVNITKNKDKQYISPRSYGNHFPDVIIALSSYFKTQRYDNPLIKGAEEALVYCIATKFGIDKKLLLQIHNNFKNILHYEKISPANSLKKDVSLIVKLDDKIRFLDSRMEEIQEYLKPDEVNYFLGSIIKEVTERKEYLIDSYIVFEKLNQYFYNSKENIKGTLALELHNAMNNFIVYCRKNIYNDYSVSDNIKSNISRIEESVNKNELLKDKNQSFLKACKFILGLDFNKKDLRKQILTFFETF